ncbi:MAG: acyl carrier protein [Oscillospiraceae bacterium]|nr:acyl carrier protein [Oscillospiraceae bacterium]
METKQITLDEIRQTIRRVMSELVEFDVSEISDDALFIEELGVNSITIVQMFLTCQDTYDVVLANEMNLAEPMSVQKLAELVYSKLN